ncbi:MAG: HD domain-containing protein [Promethearchaeota archaeon]
MKSVKYEKSKNFFNNFLENDPSIQNSLKSPDLKAIIKIYYQFQHLKHIFRKGWLQHGIPKDICESDADHSLGVAFLAIIISNHYYPDLNQEKLLKMAILHEFGETVIGDITPSEERDYNARKQEEINIVNQFFRNLPNGDDLIELYRDFEEQRTPEGIFLKQIDSLEMVFQAFAYETENSNKKKDQNLETFFQTADKRLKFKEIQAIFRQLQNMRKKT